MPIRATPARAPKRVKAKVSSVPTRQVIESARAIVFAREEGLERYRISDARKTTAAIVRWPIV